MTVSDRFYCVRCNRLEELANGDVLFKTGYFRVVHPLGCCESCRAEATAAATGCSTDFLAGADSYKQEPVEAEPRVLLTGRGYSLLEWAAV